MVVLEWLYNRMRIEMVSNYPKCVTLLTNRLYHVIVY